MPRTYRPGGTGGPRDSQVIRQGVGIGDEKNVRLTIHLPVSLDARLRVEAGRRQQSVSAYVRELIKAEFTDDTPEKP